MALHWIWLVGGRSTIKDTGRVLKVAITSELDGYGTQELPSRFAVIFGLLFVAVVWWVIIR